MDFSSPILLGIMSLLGGVCLFRILLFLVPFLETKNLAAQRDAVISEAKTQKQRILTTAESQRKDDEELFLEELEANLVQQEEDLLLLEQELDSRQTANDSNSLRIDSLEETAARAETALSESVTTAQVARETYDSARSQLTKQLENISGLNAQSTIDRLASGYTESRQLDVQKVMKQLQEHMDASARKNAQRVLDRVLARYQPRFVWPKPSNVVEITNKELAESIKSESCHLINDLAEISEVNIGPIPTDQGHSNGPLLVRVAGGFGIHREAARSTLVELLERGPTSWNQARNLFATTCMKIEAEAERLGGEAVRLLQLDYIHPEIQRLVGALNWRTSYRQNQWHHTVEVAILAGVIGSELGIDPALAKRVGMLHDIGKAIDYRIDGSHAVISGDYADRFGESRLVCDTVMSHHADLIVETPLAYVLRAADTLSGARPGARVNLEEGYQIRIGAIYEAVQSFIGISDIAIMNGGREVHIQVNYRKVKETEIRELTCAIAKKIESEVAFPGKIKVVVSRPFESVSIA